MILGLNLEPYAGEIALWGLLLVIAAMLLLRKW